jgi:hypothetical protein
MLLFAGPDVQVAWTVPHPQDADPQLFIHDPLTGGRTQDPRNVAKKTEAYLKEAPASPTAFFGARRVLSSTPCSSTRHRRAPSTASTRPRPRGTWWGGGDRWQQGLQGVREGRLAGLCSDHYADLRDQVTHQPRTGRHAGRARATTRSAPPASQINTSFNSLLLAADQMMLFKFTSSERSTCRARQPPSCQAGHGR